MRLIDADALAKFIDYGHLNDPNENLYSENDIREMIDMMPTIHPVKHGHWIEIDTQYVDETKCSVCGVIEYFNKGWKRFNYCPNCGAKMDEVKE